MEPVKDKIVLWLILTGCLLYGLAVFFLTRALYGRTEEKKTIQRDTIVVVDTFRTDMPKVTETRYVGYVKEKPVLIHDTAVIERQPEIIYLHNDSVEIPLSQKKYSDSTYTAWVSGYRPSLDSIEVYRRTEIQREVVTLRKKAPRWGIGITGGYGYGTRNKGFEPFVGIGVYYRIL